ncbi:MAG: hypothetical protein M0R51_06385 [Clostridia bacterium]|jgi:hypothetical protein|nr:hypothetical protein [Clostridia bacterium]
MKLYKILIKKGDKYYSPYQCYRYGKLEDFLGKKLTIENFDTSDSQCSNGFYATPISGLIYTGLSDNVNKVVFEMSMTGINKKFSDYKWRWESQIFVKELTIEEVKSLVREESSKMDWNYYDMLFPKNPLGKISIVTENHKQLLKQWSSVWSSVRDSVGSSVWSSVGDSVGDSIWSSVWSSVGSSVWSSVGDSVWSSIWSSVWSSIWSLVGDSIWSSVRDSVGAYVSSGFPNIKKWKYIDHEEGINPFQSGIDLWNDNLVPSFDGKTWRLHSGSKAEIVFEISKEELMKL